MKTRPPTGGLMISPLPQADRKPSAMRLTRVNTWTGLCLR